MNATATEARLIQQPWGGKAAARRLWPVLLVVGVVVGGCAEEPLPKRAISRDDCLRELSLATLKERLEECNAVVAAFPGDPAPLNDRYLLHSLAGNDQAACTDLRKAIALARAIPKEKLDEQLRIDLEVREQLCKSSVTGPLPKQP
jgi:hypothetical protein